MRAAIEYARLESEMLSSRAGGRLSDNRETVILEHMDVLWEQMSDEERAEADRRVARIASGEYFITTSFSGSPTGGGVPIQTAQAPRGCDANTVISLTNLFVAGVAQIANPSNDRAETMILERSLAHA